MCIFTGAVLFLRATPFLMPENILKEVFLMDSEVIAAFIALGGVILSVGISFIVSLWTRRYNYNQLFAETVSESRNKWLNEMRDSISTMLAEAQNPCTLTDEDAQCKNKKCLLTDDKVRSKKYWKARNEIVLRLNLTEPFHQALFNEIRQLDCLNNNNQEQTINNIITFSQEILKEEWEKVKSEAKGE